MKRLKTSEMKRIKKSEMYDANKNTIFVAADGKQYKKDPTTKGVLLEWQEKGKYWYPMTNIEVVYRKNEGMFRVIAG